MILCLDSISIFMMTCKVGELVRGLVESYNFACIPSLSFNLVKHIDLRIRRGNETALGSRTLSPNFTTLLWKSWRGTVLSCPISLGAPTFTTIYSPSYASVSFPGNDFRQVQSRGSRRKDLYEPRLGTNLTRISGLLDRPAMYRDVLPNRPCS